MDAALVELVDHDRRDIAQQRIPLQVAVRMPSVTTSSRVSSVKCRSKRMCQPTSRPMVQPRSSAMRFAIARAATRRGCSRKPAALDERRRDARRLARARRRDQHRGAVAIEIPADLIDEVVDG